MAVVILGSSISPDLKWSAIFSESSLPVSILMGSSSHTRHTSYSSTILVLKHEINSRIPELMNQTISKKVSRLSQKCFLVDLGAKTLQQPRTIKVQYNISLDFFHFLPCFSRTLINPEVQ